MLGKIRRRCTAQLVHALQERLISGGLYLTRAASHEGVEQSLHKLRPRVSPRPLIRLGRYGDGGYLVPDDLDGILACFSPGVDDVAYFELALADRGIPSFLADATVAAPPIENELFSFEKKFVGVLDDQTTTTLESWVSRNINNQGDLLLQMDIEGDEVPVLLSTPQSLLQRFRVMVIEFHSMERMFEPQVCKIWNRVIEKITASHFVVHVHPNNCNGAFQVGQIVLPQAIELTLYRKDRFSSSNPPCYVKELPHPLDAENCPSKRSLGLSPAWFGE